MFAKLEGPVFGPYHCSNCMIKQPDLRCNCIFCGHHFTNYEDILIEEDAERFIIHMKEAELRNESNISRRD